MSSNYSSFSIGSFDPRQVRFSPNAQQKSQPGFVGESAGCSTMLIDPDDSLTAQCRHHNAEFCIIAGNAKTALYVQLWNVRCRDGISESEPETWIPLNIAGYKYITLYARKMDDHNQRFILHGYPVAPLEGGKVVFLFYPGVLDCIGGIYEGEVEIEFKDERIVTAIEWVKFKIVEDFSGHGAQSTNPECNAEVDHMPEIPGIQFPLEPGAGIAQLPLGPGDHGCCGGPVFPDMPGVLPPEISPQLRRVMQRNSIQRLNQ